MRERMPFYIKKPPNFILLPSGKIRTRADLLESVPLSSHFLTPPTLVMLQIEPRNKLVTLERTVLSESQASAYVFISSYTA